MSRWFRLYEDFVDDPKVQMLPDNAFRALVNLWCLASRNGGILPSDQVIGFALRMKTDKVAGVLAGLVGNGLIDCDSNGVRTPHNWEGRQFKSDVSNERVKRHRQRQRNVTPAVSGTPPDTDTETDRKKDAADAALPSPSNTPEVEFYRRGKSICGASSGGLLRSLLKMERGDFDLAMAKLTVISKKENPREYLNGMVRQAAETGKTAGEGWERHAL